MADHWYKDKIEDPLKDMVKELRNNGINTECSCGHDMYIQCQYIPDGSFYEVHKIVWNYLSMNKGVFGYDTVDFDIEVSHQVRGGHFCSSLGITFPVKRTDRKKLEKKKKYHEEQIARIDEDLKRLENEE